MVISLFYSFSSEADCSLCR